MEEEKEEQSKEEEKRQMKEEEEQTKKKYMQLQMLQQQIEEVNTHLEMFAQNHSEMEISINAIKELDKTKIDNEILAPIANGVFLKAKLLDNKKLIVNVGSNITVERTIPEVIKLLEEQKKEAAQTLEAAQEVMQQLNTQGRMIIKEIEEIESESD